MAESMLQQQLDEVRALLRRARELFGSNPIAPQEDWTRLPATDNDEGR